MNTFKKWRWSMRRDWVAFAGCAFYAAGGLLSLLAILSIGPLVLLLTLAIGVPLAIKLGDRLVSGWPGLGFGAALPLMMVAWLNRAGPGDVCTHSGGGIQCAELWNPWPFLVIALVLMIAGPLTFGTLPRRTDG